jgi:RNA polymerase sigma-70 factor (ECF subfamily)
MGTDTVSDDELLQAAAREPQAYARFYRRHADAVLRYMLFRTGDGEQSAELTAEVFVAALASSRRYRRTELPARAWLFGIANHKLADSRRRGRIEDRARRRMGAERLQVHDAALERAEELADLDRDGLGLEALVFDLPKGERDAVLARVVDERSYGEVAGRLGISEATARKRVSRGLARLAFWVREDGA